MLFLKGTKYTFKAFPNPSEASWPSGTPNWSGVASGTGETIDVTFNSGGTYTLTAKCGSGDTGKTVTIKVVVSRPDQVSFVDNSAGEEHDIYGVDYPVWTRVSSPDNPASYTKDKFVKVQAKFWAIENLAYSTQIYVDLEGTGNFTFTEDTTVTFGSWPSETTTHTSDSKLTNSIGSTNLTFTWKYKVPSGTNTWIPMASQSGSHKIYRVYGAPECSASEYTGQHLEKATTYAEGEGPSASNVCTTLQNYLHTNKNFTAATGPDGENGVWNIIEPDGSNNQGDCIAHANLMQVCLKVLGIDASYAYVADATNQASENGPTNIT